MNLLPTDEQEQFAAASAAFLAAAVPMSSIHCSIGAPDNVDAAAWVSAADLGWFGLGLSEEVGGFGAGLADETLLFREIGRSLAPGPYVATVLGARVAALGGAEALATSIVAGSSRVALALAAGPLELSADQVTGEFHLVDNAGADHVLVITPELAVLVTTASLLDVTDSECIDESTRLATGRADRAPVIAAVSASDDAIWRRGLVLTAALLVGMAEATRDIAAEYAKTRLQFDRPIGVNQAVKHPCADMAIRCEAALAQTIVAALAHDEGSPAAEAEALSARVVAEDAGERNTSAALQVLGGIGFTAEHEIHLFVKRAHVLSWCIADRRTLLDRLITL